MFHRKRFRSAIAIILTLLLTVALASIVAAQTPPGPGPIIDDGIDPTPGPPVPGPSPPATSEPGVPPPPPGTTPTPTPTDTNGGMDNGGMDNGGMDNDMSAPPPDSWPPPNALVHHAATPVQISSLAGGLNVYLVGPDGNVVAGPVLDSISTLAEAHPSGDAVSLYSGTNPGSGKSVEIVYLPNEMKIRVSTYYADSPPHDYNKPYVFIIDADHSVTHESW